MYAIVDIETTGGSPRHERITEIAIFVHDGNQVIDEFTTLINPERLIPPFITQLTGISNEMVAESPKFYEVAKKIIEYTEDMIFVAHNANFDYNFIKSEFNSLGFKFKREVLCTVQTSRKLMPGHKSYSLGKICEELGIKIEGRHRTAGDALATVRLFEILLGIDKQKEGKSSAIDKFALKGLHNELDRNVLKSLPQDAGVYYFYDENKSLIYVGKSKNIQKRVLSHLNNEKGQRAIEMKARICDISYECTGSELIALLLESDEIKKQKPIYNRAQRRSMLNHGLLCYTDRRGYKRLIIEKNKIGSQPLTCFSSQVEAREYLYRMIEQYELCQKMCGLYQTDGACFHHGVGLCKGACSGIETPTDYNLRVDKLLKTMEFEHDNFLIIDNGRYKGEKAVVKVLNGAYCGFGYVDDDALQNSPELLNDCIKTYSDTKDVRQIISLYLRQGKAPRVIKIENDSF